MSVSLTFEEKRRILTDNLKEFNKKHSTSSKQKELCAFELAHLLCESYTNLDGILNEFNALSDDLSPADKMVFLAEICRSEHSEKIKEMLLIGSNEETTAGAHSKISYLKNRYNDIAFERFSEIILHAKPDYASSFSECCENVFDGRSEFCILPIMNSSDGRLMSFYNLLDRYELKIYEVISIDGDDTSTTFRHALVGRSCKERATRREKDQEYIFEFYVIADGSEFFTPLLLAAEKVGATLICIDSLPMEYDTDMQKFFFSFKVPSQNALAFRLFVELNHTSYTPLGFYAERN